MANQKSTNKKTKTTSAEKDSSYTTKSKSNRSSSKTTISNTTNIKRPVGRPRKNSVSNANTQSSGELNISTTQINRAVKKVVKKTHWVTILCVALFLIIGLLAGMVTYNQITKDDVFEVVGDKEINLNIGDTYTELGAIAKAWGKDVSKDIVITGVVDTTQEGSYNIVYTVNHCMYKGVRRIRVVNVGLDTQEK